MLSIAAAQLGYKCHIFDPHEHPPAADVAAYVTRAAYDDIVALRDFARSVDVATYEFENLPVAALEVLGDKLRPIDALAGGRAGPRSGESVHRRMRRSSRSMAAGCQPRRRSRGTFGGGRSAGAQDPPLRL